MSTQMWRSIVGAMLGLGALFACVMAYALITLAGDRPLPFSYMDVTPAGAYPRLLCPGDLLQFDLEIVIHDAPGVVLMAENWQSPARIIPDAQPRFFIQEAEKVTRMTRSATVPDLAAGAWTYERGASVPGVAYPAVIEIPFEVKEGCNEFSD